MKVTDHRRFNAEGEPVERPEPAGDRFADPPPEDPSPSPPPDPRLAEQAARIDHLSRAYAALVEDNKAFRQRMERERERVIAAERASVAQSLLEAADDLERALAAVSGAGDAGGEALRSLVDGVRLSLGALHKRIAELGAIRMAVAGTPFDPRVAEAVDTVTVQDAEQDGLVVQEVRPGWRIGDRVLRPARVRVGRMAQA